MESRTRILKQSYSTAIRARFAPSPTGYLHLGGLRTALLNHLFVKKNGGKLILRIEDTDQSRLVPGSADGIEAMLQWCGIGVDESPTVGGPFGPYVQSERKEIYAKHANDLLSCGHAYHCFCTPDRLDQLRNSNKKKGLVKPYDKKCQSLTAAEVQENLDNGVPYTIRLKVPTFGETSFRDLVHGPVKFRNQHIDDQILLKSDGMPTYHLANVVDDHLMQISHVIRGEEWLSSTPKHIITYQAFGWKAPDFAHLPLLLNKDRTKLSKRSGTVDAFVENYRDKGYFPEALLSYLATVSLKRDGDDRQLFHTCQDLVDKFSFEKISPVNVSVYPENLEKINRHCLGLRMAGDAASRLEVAHRLASVLTRQSSFGAVLPGCLSDEYLLQVLDLLKERVCKVDDFAVSAAYFFFKPDYHSELAAKMRAKVNMTENELKTLCMEASVVEDSPTFETNLVKAFGEQKIALRYVTTGYPLGARMEDTLSVLGRQEVKRRLTDFGTS